jgi:hypothetical protein
VIVSIAIAVSVGNRHPFQAAAARELWRAAVRDIDGTCILFRSHIAIAGLPCQGEYQIFTTFNGTWLLSWSKLHLADRPHSNKAWAAWREHASEEGERQQDRRGSAPATMETILAAYWKTSSRVAITEDDVLEYGKSREAIDRLTAEQRRVTQEAGTERPFTGEYNYYRIVRS